MIYRPLISTQRVTPKLGDDPAVPNAQPGVTVPYDPSWAEATAAVLADPDNRAALELLKRRAKQRTATLPTCLGVTFESCSESIREAGLTGTITKRTLSADEAIIEEDPNRVTAIHPRGTVLRTDEVTVYINPATMPTMTATETLVATQLEQKNPGVVEVGAEKPFAYKTIARRCVKAASAAGSGISPTDCGSLPIFVTGYDAAAPAENDAAAIKDHPSWVMLHRRTSRDNRGWYTTKDGCLRTEYDAYEAEFGYRPQCHDYPFWSTHQAYNGLLNDAQPRIKLTSPVENRDVQGKALQHFFGTNRGLPWPVCNIPAVADDTLAVMPDQLSRAAAATAAGSAFLNVPIGEEGGRIRTVGLCNGRAAG